MFLYQPLTLLGAAAGWGQVAPTGGADGLGQRLLIPLTCQAFLVCSSVFDFPYSSPQGMLRQNSCPWCLHEAEQATWLRKPLVLQFCF